jgi:hypothetical protein
MKCVWVSAWEGSRTLPLWRDHIEHIEPPVDWRLQETSSWENLLTRRDQHVPAAWNPATKRRPASTTRER